MKSLQTFLIIIFLFIITPAFSAEYYIWKEENGATVITNVPPPNNIKKNVQTIPEESDQSSIQTETSITEQKVGDVPPPLVFAEPPNVVVIPSGNSYIYMVPDVTGIYFYQGLWYRFHHNRWFRSTIYNGDWVLMDTSNIPLAIVRIPPEYPLYIPVGYQRINYNDLHREWRLWDNNRHWDSFEWYKHEMRPETKRERFHDIEMGRAREPHTGSYRSASTLNPPQLGKNSQQGKQAPMMQKKKSAVAEQTRKKPQVKNKIVQPRINEQRKHLLPERKEKPIKQKEH